MTKQIIFVDSSVKDYQSLIQDADTAEIVILNNYSSGILLTALLLSLLAMLPSLATK